jgi:hypothetical protein
MLELRAPDTFQENPRARIHGSVTRALHSEVQNVGGAAGKIQTYTLVPRAGPEKGGTTHSVHTVSSEVGKDARGRTRRVLVVAQARGQKLLSLRVLHTKG